MDLLPLPGPHVFLSPHFDDAALSCGGWAAVAAAAGAAGLCVTLFAAPPPAGEPLSPYAQRLHARWGESDPQGGNALRRAEDAAAAALLGLDVLWLDYPDAIYRHGRYLGHDPIFGAVHADEAGLPAALAAAITAGLAARDLAGARLYAPLGLGHHVDHQLTFLAATILAAAGWDVLYYDDFPYASQPQAHAARFLELGAAGPAFRPHYAAIDAGIETKIAAIAAYPSQLSSLFPSPDAMPPAVREYAAAVAAEGAAVATPGGPAARYAERYWRGPGPR